MIYADWLWIYLLVLYLVLIALPHYAYSVWLPTTWQYEVTFLHDLVLLCYWLWTPSQSIAFRQHWIWHHVIHNYFQFKVVGPGAATLNGDERKQYIYALHPHGLYASAVSYWAVSPHLTHCRAVGTSLLFYLPIVKDLISLGGVIRANRTDMVTTLMCNESIVVTPGGMQEVLTWGHTYTDHLGFLRIAQATRVPIVPIYAKGVDQLYDVWLFWPRIQRIALHLFYYPIFVFSRGLWWLPFWPKRPINGIQLCVGKPIYTTHNESLETVAKRFYSQITQLKQM